MAGKIFINYRRDDDPQAAGRLFDRLQDDFAADQLFFDVDNIAPGLDFPDVLAQRIGECEIFLAVIGRGWVDSRDASGARRLDDPRDFVRIEIRAALDQTKRVIPVLIGDTPMPQAHELPEPLQPLVWRNAVRLSHTRFRSDVQGLIKALHEALRDIETETRRKAERAEEEAKQRRSLEEAERSDRTRKYQQSNVVERRSPEDVQASQGDASNSIVSAPTESPAFQAEALLAAITLGALGLFSGFLTAYTPWTFFTMRLIPDTILPSLFQVYDPLENTIGGIDTTFVPFLPPIWFAIVLCAGFFWWGSRNPFYFGAIFIAVVAAWICAWEGVCAVEHFFVFPFLSELLSGIVGGFGASCCIALSLWICSRDCRTARPILFLIVIGTIAGVAYVSNFLAVNVVWQPTIAGIFAYSIVAPKVAVSAPKRLTIVTRRRMAEALIVCLIAIGGFVGIEKVEASISAREDAQYARATGNIQALQAYLQDCRVCGKKFEASQAINELRETNSPTEDHTSEQVAPPPNNPSPPPKPAASVTPPRWPDPGTVAWPDPGTTTWRTTQPSTLPRSVILPILALSADRERALKPKDTFKECADCPQMIVVPAGSFIMGSPLSEPGRNFNEGPQHQVTIAHQFAVGEYALTFAQWDACVSDGGCKGYKPGDEGWGRKSQPLINVSWRDAQAYVAWLSAKTQKPYRLLSEAEYEYSARAKTPTAYPWGNTVGVNNANCSNCGSPWDNKKVAPVGSFSANGFGLFDAVGNVLEWTNDCYHDSYSQGPSDGSAWDGIDCARVARGGSWNSSSDTVRSAYRISLSADFRGIVGIRIGRTLMSP
jgi:formylglycine-generating enzyme required for sulfatase activity